MQDRGCHILSTLNDKRAGKRADYSANVTIGGRDLGGRKERTGGQDAKYEMRPRAAWVRSEHETHSDCKTGEGFLTLLHGYKVT